MLQILPTLKIINMSKFYKSQKLILNKFTTYFFLWKSPYGQNNHIRLFQNKSHLTFHGERRHFQNQKGSWQTYILYDPFFPFSFKSVQEKEQKVIKIQKRHVKGFLYYHSNVFSFLKWNKCIILIKLSRIIIMGIFNNSQKLILDKAMTYSKKKSPHGQYNRLGLFQKWSDQKCHGEKSKVLKLKHYIFVQHFFLL